MTTDTDSGTLHSRPFEGVPYRAGINHVELWMLNLILTKQLSRSRRSHFGALMTRRAALLAAEEQVSVQTVYCWRRSCTAH